MARDKSIEPLKVTVGVTNEADADLSLTLQRLYAAPPPSLNFPFVPITNTVPMPDVHLTVKSNHSITTEIPAGQYSLKTDIQQNNVTVLRTLNGFISITNAATWVFKLELDPGTKFRRWKLEGASRLGFVSALPEKAMRPRPRIAPAK